MFQVIPQYGKRLRHLFAHGWHTKLTQIEGIVKAHLAKVNFDRKALDMDVRYISKPEKVDAERRAMEEAAEAEREAIAKREAAKEKARKKD